MRCRGNIGGSWSMRPDPAPLSRPPRAIHPCQAHVQPQRRWSSRRGRSSGRSGERRGGQQRSSERQPRTVAKGERPAESRESNGTVRAARIVDRLSACASAVGFAAAEPSDESAHAAAADGQDRARGREQWGRWVRRLNRFSLRSHRCFDRSAAPCLRGRDRALRLRRPRLASPA